MDPAATGVLPICVGQATRLVEFVVEGGKTYRAEIELGKSTDTYDALGQVTETSDISHITRESIENALSAFRGVIEQTPPMYSAVKHRGVPLYRAARKGLVVPRKARRVEFSGLEILEWTSPVLVLHIDCGRGAYIRSLAHDLGERLSCGAHLKYLMRIKSGPFHIDSAVSMPELEKAASEDRLKEYLYPLDIAVRHLPSVVLEEGEGKAVVHGRPIDLKERGCSTHALCRAYAEDGRLLALISYDAEQASWRPKKVLAKAAA